MKTLPIIQPQMNQITEKLMLKNSYCINMFLIIINRQTMTSLITEILLTMFSQANKNVQGINLKSWQETKASCYDCKENPKINV